MLNLPEPSAESLDSYYNSIKDRIEQALYNSLLHQKIKNYLTTLKIKELITSKPAELISIHNQLILLLDSQFSINDYNNYIIFKSKPKESRTSDEQNLIDYYEPVIKEVKKVFNYNEFISSHKKTSYNLAQILNRNTCTYCNRIYTITVNKKSKKTNKYNDKGRITRPQFDHWFSKNKYPFLALSFFNLIPSCSICNASLKGDADFDISTHIHPYIDNPINDFKFSFRFKDVYESNVIIKAIANSKIATSLAEFKIEEVYDAHSNLELKDLLELKFKYSEDYLDTLFNETFKSMDISEKEAYRLTFGAEYDELNFHKRPFSKFKKDIIEELRRIDRRDNK